MNTWAKIGLTIVLSIAFFLGGLMVTLVVLLAGTGSFLTLITLLIVLLIWFFLLTQIWKFPRKNIRYKLFGAAACLILLALIGNGIYTAYHNNIEEISEQGVNLVLYEPFRADTKAVILSEPSSLKLEADLPKLDGATALYPIYAAFARAVYPEGDYSSDFGKHSDDYVVCTSTDGAYNRLIEGSADIIFVAEPSKEQLRMAEEVGVELKLTPIGREAFVFFVNAKNPVNNLTLEEIQQIYAGEVTNWKELGGSNARIKAYQRPVNSGSQTALLKFMGGIPLMTSPGEDVVSLMGGIINKVSNYKNYNSAIGYSFLFFATEMVNDQRVKLLSLNGIAPTRENVANGLYPYASEFYAVTAGSKNPNVDAFIAWILSTEGQYLIEKTGYTPLTGVTDTGANETAVYQKITPAEAAAMMEQDNPDRRVVVLDVRNQEEYADGHINNAILLPVYEIEATAKQHLDPDDTILVYCRTGIRSEAAAKALLSMGYPHVYDFGGIMNWPGDIVYD